jgi:hypothetical protein
MKYVYILIIVASVAFKATAQTASSRDGSGSTTAPRLQTKILKAYPNPAITYITFDFTRSYSSGLSIELFNLPGKKVASASNVQSSITIQLQNFYRGVYIYKLIDKNGKVMESGKFQVVK